MAKLVFVHGVNVRKDADYQKGVDARDGWFTRVVFNGAVSITNPYWGVYGAKPLTCIPAFGAKYDHLGVVGLGAEPGLEAVADDAFVEAAQQDFPAVVAGLSVAGLEAAAESGDPAEIKEAEALWAAAAAYAELQPHPAWLTTVTTNDEFLGELRKNAEGMGAVSLSVFDPFKKAADKLVGGLSNLVNSPVGRFGREAMSPKIAIFIGDVFRYLKGAARDDIRKELLGAIKPAAIAAHAAGEKLILAAHSMGGVILYDILSDTAEVAKLSAELGFPLKVDLLVTIGSQVAVFEEMKVFESSDPARAGKTPRPACVETWWNVFDTMDVLSFLTEPVFDGVEDFHMDTIAGVKDAHGAYFLNAVFYQRLRKRMVDAKLV